ncbi:MAG: GntR family transcriptional regulator, partial [Myxococcota bacterium]
MGEVVLELGEGVGPLFSRLCTAVIDSIEQRRFGPGERLPSSRALARSLGIHRNTVLRAYRELELQGWIETRPAQGTYIADELRHQDRRSEIVNRRPRAGDGVRRSPLRGPSARRVRSTGPSSAAQGLPRSPPVPTGGFQSTPAFSSQDQVRRHPDERVQLLDAARAYRPDVARLRCPRPGSRGLSPAHGRR